MCGIAGFIAHKEIKADSLFLMTDLIKYRGPDDEGFTLFSAGDQLPMTLAGEDTPHSSEMTPSWFPITSAADHINTRAKIGFGHRRLSILDLSPLGHQPMSYDDGRYWITYNGEIYNYIELRNELQSLGHRFITQSDTEVILAAYAEWGTECLSHFNGMWAFSIYDTKNETVFLARDRFGVKPLYYWNSPGGTFFFGSEIKQFTVLPGWKPILNSQRAYDFLNWGITDHTDETLFKGVYHIRSGHYALLSVDKNIAGKDGRIDQERWYDLNPLPFTGSYEDSCHKFRDLLKDSVRLRLRADVAVGSCLSGGLDSSSIVCLMNNELAQHGAKNLQKTFSACSDVKRFDERPWIEKVVSHTGAQAHYTYPKMDDLFAASEKITWHQDEPFGSTSIYAQWNVFKLSADNQVRVMLDGQGADEQLAGYHGFFGARISSLFLSGQWVQMIGEIVSIHKKHGYSLFWILGQAGSCVLPARIKNLLRKIMGRASLTPDWLNMNILGARPADPYKGTGSSIRKLCYSQMTSTNLQMLLRWEDRDSMAHSIESRVPFLDYRLVEFSMSLPDDYKIKNGITKRVLRDGMDGILPEQIKNRTDKIGFATPEEVWVRETAPDLFRKKLRESIAASNGVLNDSAMNILEEIIDGRRPFSFIVWRMINFGEWIKLFSVQHDSKEGVIS